MDAFRTPLWTAPPPPPLSPPPTEDAPPSAVPPTRLTLLAIVTGTDGVRRATLYDPDTDRVESIAPGDRCGSATVDTVGTDAVTITDAAGTRALRLRPGEPARPGLGGGR